MVKKTGITLWQALQALKNSTGEVIGVGRKEWPQLMKLSRPEVGHLIWMDGLPAILTTDDYFGTDWFIKEKAKPTQVEGWAIINRDGTLKLGEYNKLYETYEDAIANVTEEEDVSILFINRIVPDPSKN
jgi:hypothetical protein